MDMRYLRTEKHLRKACLHLREKAGIPSLTVTQLTRGSAGGRVHSGFFTTGGPL